VTEGEKVQAADARALAEQIRERVKRERGIDLEYEVELWSSGAGRSEGRGQRAKGGEQGEGVRK